MYTYWLIHVLKQVPTSVHTYDDIWYVYAYNHNIFCSTYQAVRRCVYHFLPWHQGQNISWNLAMISYFLLMRWLSYSVKIFKCIDLHINCDLHSWRQSRAGNLNVKWMMINVVFIYSNICLNNVGLSTLTSPLVSDFVCTGITAIVYVYSIVFFNPGLTYFC